MSSFSLGESAAKSLYSTNAFLILFLYPKNIIIIRGTSRSYSIFCTPATHFSISLTFYCVRYIGTDPVVHITTAPVGRDEDAADDGVRV